MALGLERRSCTFDPCILAGTRMCTSFPMASIDRHTSTDSASMAMNTTIDRTVDTTADTMVGTMARLQYHNSIIILVF